MTSNTLKADVSWEDVDEIGRILAGSSNATKSYSDSAPESFIVFQLLYSCIIIGAGHNGLTTRLLSRQGGAAAARARAARGGRRRGGHRSDRAGVSQSRWRTRRDRCARGVRDMQLAPAASSSCGPDPALWSRSRSTGAPLRVLDRRGAHGRGDPRVLRHGRGAIRGFCATSRGSGRSCSACSRCTPPSLSEPGAGELWDLLKIGPPLPRRSDRTDGFRLLRWMPDGGRRTSWPSGSSADLLQAAIAARGHLRHRPGPVVRGNGRRAAAQRRRRSRARRQQRDGRRGARRADGARWPTRRAKPAPRSAPARPSAASWSATAAPPASCSMTARRSTPRAVIANTDPRRTLLHLVDPVDLDPGFLTKMRNYRCRGTVAKLDFALGSLPVVPRVPQIRRPSRPASHRPDHRLSRTRVRRVEIRRLSRPSRISTSRSRRCTIRRWRRQDDMSCPSTCSSRPTSSPADGPGTRCGTRCSTTVLRTLERYAPGHRAS